MSISWSTEKRKLKDLKDYEHNPRSMSKEDFKRLVDSIKEDGYHQRLLIDTDGVIIGGHSRKKALLKSGMKGTDEIEVLVPSEKLSEEEFDRINVKDNLGFGSWDFDMLGNRFDPETLIGWGMPEDWLNVDVEVIEPEEGDDDVPDVPVEPTTKLGDVWLLGEHRLMCGDSVSIDDVDKLMGDELSDLVFTDPPYGVEYQSGMRAKSDRFEKLANDDVVLDIAPILFSKMKENSPAFVWTSHGVYPKWRAQVESLYKHTIIWHKAAGGMGDLKGNYATDYEMALFCVKGEVSFKGKRGMAVWGIGKDSNSTYQHPTQKPIALALKAISEWTRAGSTVLDLFGGSGSTLIACEKSKRKCFMMELDPKYCDVIIARWEKISGEKAILENV